MRVVSLVPSWTETLIEAGADVVGRTRFCIHPADRVRSIPAVGGTKDINLDKIAALAPDLIVLDREENTREMADALGSIARLHVSHVDSAQVLPRELRALANALGGSTPRNAGSGAAPGDAGGGATLSAAINSATHGDAGGGAAPGDAGGGATLSAAINSATHGDASSDVAHILEAFAHRFESVVFDRSERPVADRRPLKSLSEDDSAVVTSVGIKAAHVTTSVPANSRHALKRERPIIYVIWKDPWMCVSRETFIASMLGLAGHDLRHLWAPAGSKYPRFELAQLPNCAHLLLSSEPFPFAKKESEVAKLLAAPELASKQLTYELVDGESFSWFGIRALRYLESL